MLKAQQKGLETIEKWFETTKNWSKLNGKVLNPPKLVSKASKVVGNEQKGLETVKNQLGSGKRWFESVEIGLGATKMVGTNRIGSKPSKIGLKVGKSWLKVGKISEEPRGGLETIESWLESDKTGGKPMELP